MKSNIMCSLFVFLVIIEARIRASSVINGKIFGGKPVVPRTMKYVASLKIRRKHFCGGCLISQKHILTAAQCINTILLHDRENFADTTVLLGTTRILGFGITRNVKDAENHPNYNPLAPFQTSAFDIGLVLLNEIVVDTNIVSQINFSKVKAKMFLRAEVVGWGSETIVGPDLPSNAIKMSSVLRKTRIIVLQNFKCQIYYKKLINITEEHICSSLSLKSTATWGDNGSPLVKDNELLGITSRVSTSVEKKLPLLFIKVSKFKDYIKQAMMRLNDDGNANLNRRELSNQLNFEGDS